MTSLSKTIYDGIDFAGLLSGVEPVCFRFAGILDSKATESQGTGDLDAALMFALLSEICTYGLKPDDLREPFGPRARGTDGGGTYWRTASIEDLNDDQLVFLASVYDTLPISELRARVADVLFVRRRHHKFGRSAIDAYLDSADLLMKPENWVDALHRLERALAISLSVKAEQSRVISRIIDEVNKRRVDGSYFSAKIMRAFLDYRVGDAAAMSPVADEAARMAFAEKEWDRAREYFGLLAQWRRKAGDNLGEQQARREAANCYIEQAASAESRSLEGAFLEQAIQSLRTMAGTQADVAKLHERLVEVQRESLKELKEHSTPVDYSKIAERARAEVTGQKLHQAIMRMSMLWRPDPVARIRGVVLATAKEHVFFSSIPRVMVNRQGKVVAKRGSFLSGTDEDRALSLRQMMFERGQQQRDVITTSVILPARTQITDEHYISHRDLMPFAQASVFVPSGREEPFAIGLAAGFNGDFAAALHLLMPQFENAIRTILAQNGTITSKIDDDGIQDERDLGWLLTCEDVEKMFGEDLVFDMRGLLIERWGSNLRNVMAHGLIEVNQMMGVASAYFWWLTLHMVVRPLIPASPTFGPSNAVVAPPSDAAASPSDPAASPSDPAASPSDPAASPSDPAASPPAPAAALLYELGSTSAPATAVIPRADVAAAPDVEPTAARGDDKP